MRRLATALSLVLCAATPAAPGFALGMAPPAVERPASIPADDELVRRGAVIGEITILVEDVFDPELPEENRRLFRLANRLHINTRSGVIRTQLLFTVGEPYTPRVLRESERLLRSNKYIYNAVIRPVRYAGNQVDLEVWVKDVWTLKVALALSRSGGENSTRVEAQDLNVLGSGAALTLRRKSDVDRTSISLRYQDNNLLGSRARVSFVYSDNSDGSRVRLEGGRPFYSLDTRWAAEMDGLSEDRLASLYSLGDVSSEFRHRRSRLVLWTGRSQGLVDGRARRFFLGLTRDENRFEACDACLAIGELPADRTLMYPWVGFESEEDAFATAQNLDQLSRPEDLLLGRRSYARLGISPEFLAGDRDLAVFEAGWARGLKPSTAETVLLAASTSGRWGGGGFENLEASAGVRYYRRNFGPHLFFVNAELGWARNLDRENQLLLGGDSGLRGYPLRYQDGDGRLLVTLEQRFFTGIYLFRLYYVGAAAFVDVGRTWAGDSAVSPNLGLLKNVGVGLRFGSTRSGFGSVVHFDLAFPLDGDPSIESVQWLVTTKESF